MNRASFPPERRAFGRRESLIHAIARIPGRAPEPCIVRDFSDTGALLEFSIAVHPSGPFRLCVEAKGIDVTCEMRRQQDRLIGVRFIGTTQGTAFGGTMGLDGADASGAAPVETPLPAITDRPVVVVDASDLRLRMFGVAGV